jgi:plasmid stabilization system protein ParE
MAFKILYTEKALADLEAILDYILADNPAAATRFGNDLLNHVDLLAAFPHIGSP